MVRRTPLSKRTKTVSRSVTSLRSTTLPGVPARIGPVDLHRRGRCGDGRGRWRPGKGGADRRDAAVHGGRRRHEDQRSATLERILQRRGDLLGGQPFGRRLEQRQLFGRADHHVAVGERTGDLVGEVRGLPRRRGGDLVLQLGLVLGDLAGQLVRPHSVLHGAAHLGLGGGQRRLPVILRGDDHHVGDAFGAQRSVLAARAGRGEGRRSNCASGVVAGWFSTASAQRLDGQLLALGQRCPRRDPAA